VDEQRQHHDEAAHDAGPHQVRAALAARGQQVAPVERQEHAEVVEHRRQRDQAGGGVQALGQDVGDQQVACPPQTLQHGAGQEQAQRGPLQRRRFDG